MIFDHSKSFLKKRSHFPHPSTADEDGLLAMGGRLDVDWLLDAYSHGIFPWPVDEENIPLLWFSPHIRTIIEPETFHISHRLRQTLRSGKFRITVDRAFRDVVTNCATQVRAHETGTWIIPEIIEGYTRFHEAGYAHSLEVWHDDALVGGIYGVGIGAAFAGESKFHLETDASKVALAWLVRHLQSRGYRLFDVQMENDHLKQFHLTQIPQAAYLSRLSEAITHNEVTFGTEPAWCREDF